MSLLRDLARGSVPWILRMIKSIGDSVPGPALCSASAAPDARSSSVPKQRAHAPLRWASPIWLGKRFELLGRGAYHPVRRLARPGQRQFACGLCPTTQLTGSRAKLCGG